MAIVEIIAAFVLLLLILCWLDSKRNSPITNWPFIGMLPGLLWNASEIHDYVCHLLQQSKQTLVIKGPYFSKLSLIVTSDSENIHYILSKNFANFNKGPAFKEIFEVLGDGILAAESDSWKMQRKLTHSLFKQSNFLRLVESTAQKKSETGLFKILDHASELGLEVDMQDLCQRFTFDVTCIFLLGTDLKSLSLDLPLIPFAIALDDIEEVVLHRHLKPRNLWKLQRWLQIGLEKKATRAERTVDQFIYHQLSLKQALNCRSTVMQTPEEETFDLISNFMQEEDAVKCNNKSRKASNKFLRDFVVNILSAGRDTSSTALTWFFWLVSINPTVKSKISEEIRLTFQMKDEDPWRFPSFKELNKLVYLHATLSETLRLYPPLPFNHKSSIKPDILPSGHRVGNNTEIIFSMYAMGRTEDIWGADCCEFRPERWISEKGSIIDVPSYKFNVFGAGPRTCVGKDLASIVMKIAAAAIVWSYNFQVVPGHSVVPANSIILHMQQGLEVYVTKKLITP